MRPAGPSIVVLVVENRVRCTMTIPPHEETMFIEYDLPTLEVLMDVLEDAKKELEAKLTKEAK
jgi:hypothetical protein